MAASQPALFNLQEFTDSGLSLVGGRLYTFVTGTTTLKIAYTDPAGLVPQTYTFDGQGGQYIALNTRGELAKPLYLLGGGYDILLKRADGSTVWMREAVGVDDSVNRFTVTLSGSGGSELIGYSPFPSGPTRSIQSRLRDTVNIRDFGAKGDGSTDDTVAINTCLAYATANYLGVIAPDGEYIVSHLVFGNQSTTSQSSAPLSFMGSSRGGCRLKIKPGSTSAGGPMFKGWSLAGVTISGFTIDTTGTDVQAINLDWKPGPGPSTHNILEDITVNSGDAGVIVSLYDLNDTVPFRVYVNGQVHNQVGFDMRQSGGLTALRECTWNQCYLKIATQNGALYDCWGFGIAFAAGAVNNLGIIGGYMYSNDSRRANFWSESYTSFQSVHSLTISCGTQVIGPNENKPDYCYFDLNLFSLLDCTGVEFIDIGFAVKMFGSLSRRDSFQNSTVNFLGGSFSSLVTVNSVSSYDISRTGLISRATGYALENFTKNIYLTLGGSGSFGANSWYVLFPSGFLKQGVYRITLDWGGPLAPYQLTASCIVCIPFATGNLNSKGAAILADVGEYFPASNTAFALRLSTSESESLPAVEFSCSASLDPTGSYIVTATKLS